MVFFFPPLCFNINEAIFLQNAAPATCFPIASSTREGRKKNSHVLSNCRELHLSSSTSTLFPKHNFQTSLAHFWIKVYFMSLSRKLYLPKSLSFGAIKWSFRALASFIKRNSLRSIHSFSSSSPWAIVHFSPLGHVPLRNLQPTNICLSNTRQRL